MKAIFLSDKENHLKLVYTGRQVQDLTFEAGLFPQFFKKQDILDDPAYFADVETVFSTWGMTPFTKEEIAKCFPSLKTIFYAAGSVQHFARPFLESGVRIFSAAAANAVPVIEYAVSQIILANKGFFQSSAVIRDNKSRADAFKIFKTFPGNYGCTVGILGAGMIGKGVIAALRQNYNLKVKVFDPFYPDEAADKAGVVKCDLKEIFKSCQTISNHLANNAQTQGLLTYEHFSLMGDNTTFINTGRGAQVVEDDLIRALKEKPTRWAILDVTMPEPPVDGHPFYSMPNVILTPHIAGSSGDEVHRMSQLMVDEFRRIKRGEASKYEVTLEMLATMA